MDDSIPYVQDLPTIIVLDWDKPHKGIVPREDYIIITPQMMDALEEAARELKDDEDDEDEA